MKTRSRKAVGARKRTGARRRTKSAQIEHSSSNAVFLVGFMGAGKSSVGRVLAQRLNWAFEDLDDRIEQREGRKVAEIFRDSGETAFRHAEHAALEQVLNELRGGVARVVALGGGAFVQKTNAALLETSGVPTVFLDAPVAELWRRCRAQAAEDGAERPLLRSIEQFEELHRARRRHYQKASVHIATGKRGIEAIADEIRETLGLREIVIRTEEGEGE